MVARAGRRKSATRRAISSAACPPSVRVMTAIDPIRANVFKKSPRRPREGRPPGAMLWPDPRPQLSRRVCGVSHAARCLVQSRNLGSVLERLLKVRRLLLRSRSGWLAPWRWDRREREPDGEARSAVGAATGGDRAPVRFGDGADDRQAEAAAAAARGVRGTL